MAEATCQGGYPDRESCNWYHGAWTVLRVLGLVSNPYWHLRFYSRYVERLESTDKTLILGCADVSTAYLLMEQSHCKINVVDLCPTPLELVRRLAAAEGRKVHCEVKDVLKDHLGEGFALIITDAFLTRFEDEEKRAVLKKVRRGLSSNGLFVTTIRIGASDEEGSSYMSSENRKRWFVERAQSRFQEIGGIQGVTVDKVGELASNYMRSMASFRFVNQSQVERLFEEEKLRIQDIEQTVVPGESEETVYLRIAARR